MISASRRALSASYGSILRESARQASYIGTNGAFCDTMIFMVFVPKRPSSIRRMLASQAAMAPVPLPTA